jgi:hypothetical protein
MSVKSRIFVVSVLLFCFLNTIAIAGPSPDHSIVITEADCTAEKLGSSIPVSAIGEPVSGVSLKPPVWTKAAGPNPGYCSVDGSMAPVSKAPGASPVNFRVVLPESWSQRAAQMGGSGFNGFIPNLLMGTDMFSRTSLIGSGLPHMEVIRDTRWVP